MFRERSRYAGQPIRKLTMSEGREVAYVLPRITPPPETLAAGARIFATDSDRLDGLAWRHLGTPEGWWMIADANRAMHPSEVLAEVGREVVIPMPGPKARGG